MRISFSFCNVSRRFERTKKHCLGLPRLTSLWGAVTRGLLGNEPPLPGGAGYRVTFCPYTSGEKNHVYF